MISPDYIKRKVEELERKDVKIPRNLVKNLGKRPHWWALNTTISIIEIIGIKVGFDNIEIDPDIKKGDVDLKFVYNKKSYLIQIKSPDFFKTKIGGKVDEEINIFYQLTKKDNLAYISRISKDNKQIEKTKLESKSIGFLIFDFDIESLKHYLFGKLGKAIKQLKGINDGFKIIAIDIRYYPIGDFELYNIISDFVKTSSIDSILLISYDYEKEKDRIIPIKNTKTSLNTKIFCDEPVWLYSKKMWVMPMKLNVDKGMNEIVKIDKGNVIFDGKTIFNIFETSKFPQDN